jgi:hypothetical protein
LFFIVMIVCLYICPSVCLIVYNSGFHAV